MAEGGSGVLRHQSLQSTGSIRASETGARSWGLVAPRLSALNFVARYRRESSGGKIPYELSRAVQEMMEQMTSQGDCEQIETMLAFRGCESLCRAVPLSRVLRRGGGVLASAGGSTATYARSRPVACIESFLSHNWATPRGRKQLALLHHFQFDGALGCLLVALLVLACLTVMDRAPTWEDEAFQLPVGILGRLTLAPLFLVLFLIRHELLSCLGLPRTMVFLDKLCIHQGDPETMRQGVTKLGAFIGVSKRMVVVYSDLYLKKLWTTYEVASFLAVHPAEHMDVVPTRSATVFLACVVCVYIYTLLNFLLRYVTSAVYFMFVFGAGCMYAYIVVIGRWAQERAATQSTLSSFTIRTCTCAVESDRAVVYANVAVLMRAKSLVPKSAGPAEALDAFDALVRRELPRAFARAFGHTCFGYRHYILFGIIANMGSCIDFLAWLNAGKSARYLAPWCVLDIIWAFTMWPLLFVICEYLACRLHALRGWRASLATLQVVALCAVPSVPFAIALLYLSGLAESSDGMLALLVALSVAGPLLPLALIRRRCVLCPRRRPAGAADAAAAAPGKLAELAAPADEDLAPGLPGASLLGRHEAAEDDTQDVVVAAAVRGSV